MSGKLVGYARTSTKDENIQEQIDALDAAGCVEVFSDAANSCSCFERPGFKQALAAMRSGDYLMVVAGNRLTPSLAEYGDAVVALLERGIQVTILGIDEDMPKEAINALNHKSSLH